jgi:uncharacterized protein (DUF2249 family)
MFFSKQEAPMSDATAPSPETTIDVRVIPPFERHGLIFGTFDRLNSGDSFLIVNDHDPRPLSHQFEARYAGTFAWQYLEQGPDVWRVRIRRTS